MFFPFFKLVILWMKCHQISSVAVCVESTEFFYMSIFKPKFNFFEILKVNMVITPRGLWPCNFFPVILILRGHNHENITCKIFTYCWIAIWGLRSARIKELKKTDSIFFKESVCFFQLFDLSTSKASNCNPTAHTYFTPKFFKI